MSHFDSLPWPYPIKYGEQTNYDADVLVLGGGIAGVWAAITAARTGARVAIMEKGDTRRSGAGGTGCDHWQWAADNPGSGVTPNELSNALVANHGGWRNGMSTYIQCASGYETLLELEAMGAKVRDVDDEFAGAPFRDEKTKLLYAYDYDNRFVIRVWGANFKPLLRMECLRRGVQIVDRVNATTLLTENGRHGARIAGAAGVNTRPGAYVVVRAKAVVLATNRPQRVFTFSSEHRGVTAFRGASNVGNGHAMAWRIGAEFTMMEKTIRSPFASPYSYPPYGSGNAINTWYPCTIVDANGKEAPWVDVNGKVLTTVEERCHPAEGQKFFIMGGGNASQPHPGLKQYGGPRLIPDLEDRMMRGEFTPPFYADMTSMPDYERRAIWGLMVGQEGRTRIPVLQTYSEGGFDPARDMLQTYDFIRGHGMREPVAPQERTFGEIGVSGGMMVDWDMMSNIPGLFGAGDLLFGAQDHSHAATTGRYVGARAALHAQGKDFAGISEEQIVRDKERVYAPLTAKPDSLDWKELNAGVARVMQNYCGEVKNAELLSLGEMWLADIAANEVPRLAADNPHKLMRALDVADILTCAQMIVAASQRRKASSSTLHFSRLDYPDLDPPDWQKFLVIRKGETDIETSYRPHGFWGDLEANYAPRAAENRSALRHKVSSAA